ncbi:YjgN family protein [Grimontia sp. NTOU-MAR1]|uniref:YjgN family protein n=1 Tax=Grimontia sp. NTOU-MAR1 TaxID=3111011 RepID=UPI002DB852CD|nr:YjgN family protein [Grimontia sp. NTOU-MAR1]WRV99458.1 YjgN family protein [Grimontia sp. NTOU-MAR1]
MENKMTFHGTGREFFGIWIVNIVLSILTFGVYSAWAKVRTKKYFYGNTELAGDRFDYHATPKQILIGRLIAVTAFVIWFLSGHFSPVFSSVLFLLGLAMMPWIARNNARFNARMTSYRNVRLNFTGTLMGAYAAILGRGLLLILTIVVFGTFAIAPTSGFITFLFVVGGLASLLVMFAWMMKGIASYFANGYGYGKLQFNATLSTGFFVRTYIWAVLIWILSSIGVLAFGALFFFVGGQFVSLSEVRFTDISDLNIGHITTALGAMSLVILMYVMLFVSMLIVTAFIHTRTRNHVFSQMMVGGSGDYRLSSKMNTADYILLVITNFFMQVLTLGLARPWVMVRTTRYILSVTAVHGDLDALSVYEDGNGAKSAVGDEMSQVFDLDIGIN